MDVIRSKQLREQRGPVGKQLLDMRKRIDDEEKRDWTAEENELWARLNGEYDAFTRQIETAERAEKIELDNLPPDVLPPELARTQGDEVTEEQRSLAFRAWASCTVPGHELEQRHLDAAKACRLNPRGSVLQINLSPEVPRSLRSLEESRSLKIATGAAGGFLQPTDMSTSIERALLTFGGARQYASVMRTATGNPISWPTSDDTSNTGSQVGEGGTISAGTDPTLKKMQLGAYKFTTGIITVSYELLRDESFGLVQFLGDCLGERLARIFNTKQTTGTGAATPTGIVTASTLGVTAASASAITADECLDLVHSVGQSYRQGGNVAFMMNDSTVLYLRKLKSSLSWMWQPSFEVGQPDRILGYPYVVNNDMAAIGASAKVILFGDMSYFKIREVNSLRFKRSDEYKIATDETVFLAFMDMDSNLLDAGTHPVKYLAMHS